MRERERERMRRPNKAGGGSRKLAKRPGSAVENVLRILRAIAFIFVPSSSFQSGVGGGFLSLSLSLSPSPSPRRFARVISLTKYRRPTTLIVCTLYILSLYRALDFPEGEAGKERATLPNELEERERVFGMLYLPLTLSLSLLLLLARYANSFFQGLHDCFVAARVFSLPQPSTLVRGREWSFFFLTGFDCTDVACTWFQAIPRVGSYKVYMSRVSDRMIKVWSNLIIF